MLFIFTKEQCVEKYKIDDDIIKAKELGIWSQWRTVLALMMLLFLIGFSFTIVTIQNIENIIKTKDLLKSINHDKKKLTNLTATEIYNFLPFINDKGPCLKLNYPTKIIIFFEISTFFVNYLIFNLNFSTKDVGLPITISTFKRCISLMTFGKFYKNFYVKDAFYGIQQKSEKILFIILSLVLYRIYLILFVLLMYISKKCKYSDNEYFYYLSIFFYVLFAFFLFYFHSEFSFSFVCVKKNGSRIKVFLNRLFPNIFKEEIDMEKVKDYNNFYTPIVKSVRYIDIIAERKRSNF